MDRQVLLRYHTQLFILFHAVLFSTPVIIHEAKTPPACPGAPRRPARQAPPGPALPPLSNDLFNGLIISV